MSFKRESVNRFTFRINTVKNLVVKIGSIPLFYPES